MATDNVSSTCLPPTELHCRDTQTHSVKTNVKPSLVMKFKFGTPIERKSSGIPAKATQPSVVVEESSAMTTDVSRLPNNSGSPETLNTKSPKQTQAKKSPFRRLYGEFVHVKVGAKEKDFGVHKGLLCEQSKYFNAAFNTASQEASQGVVKLPESDPATFEIVYTWLYTGKLTQATEEEDTECDLGQVLDLYLFGTKYEMPRLSNKAIDLIIRKYERKSRLMTKSIPKMYQYTTTDSPIRKAVIATYMRDHQTALKILDKYSPWLLRLPEFLLDLSKAFAVKPATSNASNTPLCPCQYHKHPEGEKCP